MSHILCLMGPTASGKTPLAIELVQRFPCEIISVDSAMIYRGMDIGTAKPSKELLKIAPHRLIDICDPTERYSAGQFRLDAIREIEDIIARGNMPLLVGGTMLYFRVLQQGIANMPRADKALREQLQQEGLQQGWEVLHARLSQVDPIAAQRIHPNDAQRIQRALEVYLLTGKSITLHHDLSEPVASGYHLHCVGLIPQDRAQLHARIHTRCQQMLAQGWVEEVQALCQREDISLSLPSMRSVGYRQIAEYLQGEGSYQTMCEKVLAATRQLAKRQLTWLRSWPGLIPFDSEDPRIIDSLGSGIA